MCLASYGHVIARPRAGIARVRFEDGVTRDVSTAVLEADGTELVVGAGVEVALGLVLRVVATPASEVI